jgi:magnesium-transporting ATPase (P-type)
MFPADLILLSSSNEGNVAYIETASLDGEKNLKLRTAYPETSKFKKNTTLMNFQGKF